MKECIIDEYITPFACKYIYIVVNPDIDKLNKRFYLVEDGENVDMIKEEYTEYDSITICNARDRENNDRATILIVHFKSTDHNDLVNTVAHESMHVVSALMYSSQIKLTDETEECWAYTAGFVAECYWKTLNKLIDE